MSEAAVPLQPAAAAERSPTAARIASVLAPPAQRSPRRVLVVDDEESIRIALTKFLRAKGFDVQAAESGGVALELLQRERFDALLCDVRMPGMSGTEVVPQALERRPDLAVLMLSAVNDASTASEALARGAVDYLMKPVELADLARAVERALRTKELEIQQRSVERLIREEVALRTGELRDELHALAETSIGVVRELVNLQEAADAFRVGHSRRVAATAAAIASALRLPDPMVADVHLAGQLHDVGELGVPAALFSKPGTLTADEFTCIKEHVRIGIEILRPLTSLAHLLPAIHDHHERWDGNGYPRQLAAEQISMGGRLLAASDAFVALTSGRPYREPLAPREALAHLSAHAGTQLDPAVFDALGEVARDPNSLPGLDEAP